MVTHILIATVVGLVAYLVALIITRRNDISAVIGLIVAILVYLGVITF